MGPRLGIVRALGCSAADIGAHSRAMLDRPLGTDTAELWVATAADDAVMVGAFQRGAGIEADCPLVRRGSGGPAVRLGAATVHVALALGHPSALIACAENTIVNRYVRPLLRALTKVASLAHFFGSDWISVAHRPVAWVGFAHDATTRRSAFEAFVALRTPFALAPRPSFRGKPHATLEEVTGKQIDPAGLADAIVDSYGRLDRAIECHPRERATEVAAAAAGADPRDDPPWAATREEAIGILGAGPDTGGTFRIGGDLLVSRDALGRLEARVRAATDAELAIAIDETLAAPGVALDGVRSLGSIRDVILAARHA
jgi:hypothetical protein